MPFNANFISFMDFKWVWKGKISTITAFFLIIFNLGGDIFFEYFLGGIAPIYGDIADLLLIAVNFVFLGPIALVGATELIPIGGDVLPIHMAIAIAGVYLRNKKR